MWLKESSWPVPSATDELCRIDRCVTLERMPQDAIERVCALQEILCAPELRRIIGSVGELPSLSRTYVSLTQAVGDPDTSISQVADIIEQDVAMSAKVLQLVNSPLYKHRSTVIPKNDLFAPRVGFAYRAGADTVVRGGYGISYLPSDLQAAS